MSNVQGLPEGVTLEQFWSPEYQANLQKNNPFVTPTVTSDVNSTDIVTNAVVQDEKNQVNLNDNTLGGEYGYKGVQHDGKGGFFLMIDGVQTATDADGNPLSQNEIDDKTDLGTYDEDKDILNPKNKEKLDKLISDGSGSTFIAGDGITPDDSKMGGLFGFMKDDKGLFQGGTSGTAFGRLKDLFAGRGFNAAKNTTESGSLDAIPTENLGGPDGSGGSKLNLKDDGEDGNIDPNKKKEEEDEGPDTKAMGQAFLSMGESIKKPNYQWSGDDIF
tara:strand:- start:282 stop:1103 length:822 start_codon:yes stop_codon:yes gene_type:complete